MKIYPYRFVFRWLKRLVVVVLALWAAYSALLVLAATAIWFWVAPQVPDLQTLLLEPIKASKNCAAHQSASSTSLPRWRIEAFAAVESPEGLNPFGIPSSRLVTFFIAAPISFVLRTRVLSPSRGASESLASKLNSGPEFPNHTLLRAIRQLVLSDIIEMNLDEETIGREVLARSYFGKGGNGLECAAVERYNTTADKLTLGQFAMLIGLLKGPTIYDPESKKTAALERRNFVLDLWRDKGIATQEDVEKAKAEPL
jgi:hypothetical protein